MEKSIPLIDIDASDRLRPVNEGVAQALAVSIGARGLFNRIGVRQTPNGATKWKLVTGAHRLRGMEIAGYEALTEGEHFLVLKVDADEARIIEAEENLARNDLSKLERALTIFAYRQAWERKHGKIERGGDRRSTEFQTAKLGGLIGAGARIANFSTWAADRLGLSQRSIERLTQIATGMTPELADQLFGTDFADRQSDLEALAALDEAKQRAIAQWIAAGNDADAIIREALGKSAKAVPENKAFNAVVSNLGRLPEPTRREALLEIFRLYPADFEWALANRQEVRDAA